MDSKKITKIVPIILAGGSGSRLWPLSRNSFPKQFLNLIQDDEYTMLQKTYKRIESIENICKPIVICNEEHRFIVAHQMKEIDIEISEIILEPEGRNTTPAITIAALKVLEKFNGTNFEPVLLILSSDHQIENEEKFTEVVEKSLQYSEKGKLVTYGIIPSPGTVIESHNAYNYSPDQKRFALLVCHINTIQLLLLGVKHILAHYKKTNNWQGEWLSP